MLQCGCSPDDPDYSEDQLGYCDAGRIMIWGFTIYMYISFAALAAVSCCCADDSSADDSAPFAILLVDVGPGLGDLVNPKP